MKRMSPATKLILGSLRSKHNYFVKKGMLAGDGSFYCSDEALVWQLGLCNNTIQRARIFLKNSGEINYVLGKHKGAVTRYWILSKGLKWEPFGKKKEGPKISAEGPRMPSEGCQNETRNNKEEITEQKNRVNFSIQATPVGVGTGSLFLESSQAKRRGLEFHPNCEKKEAAVMPVDLHNFSFTEEQRKGLKVFAKFYGVAWATRLLVDKGYDQKVIQQILEGVENDGSLSEV